MNGFSKEPEEIKIQQLLACERVIRSGWYVLGEELKHFESIWAEMCQTKYSLGVANGMDAIEISLRVLDISEGDEVITTTMTAFATVLAIIRAGATPILADIDLSSGNLSPESVERCITPKTKAIILVHLYGQATNMDKWLSITNKYGIHLIEDCAQSHLAEWKGKKVGSFGSLGCFSFYPTKNLGALGDAGAITTSSQEFYNKALRLRNYGQSERYYHSEIGLNSRLDEIHAAILIERVKYINTFIERRIQIAKLYLKNINNPIIEHLNSPLDKAHVYHLFVIRCKFRDSLHSYLKEKEIETFIHYPVPVHKQKITSSLICDPLGLNNAEIHASSCLSIPCHPQMTDDEVFYIINMVNSFYA